MAATPHGLAGLIAAERRRQRGPLLAAVAAAMAAATASVCLLGLSGWFITGAAIAGATGAVMAFNYMLPSAAIRMLAIVRTACRYFERLSGHEAAFGALAAIRPAIFRALASGPAEAALRLSAGEASSRLIQDVDEVESLFVRISGHWAAGAALVSGAVLCALAGWRPAAATVLFFLAALLAAHGLARRLSARPGREALQAMGRLKDSYASLAAAAPELVCYGLQDWAADRLAEEGLVLDAARLRAARAQGWQSALILALSAAAAIAALLLAAGADLRLAALAALAAAVTMEAAAAVARGFERDGAVAEAARRLDPLFAGATADTANTAIPVSAKPPLTLVGPDNRLTVVEAGGRLAITGSSGCGKTTLLERLLRLRDVDDERLLIDGEAVRGLTPAQARATFAYCPQDICLLSASVRENLMLGRADADEPALWAALHDAGLDQRVQALPEGLDTWIGEGGERLSGGERRRLSLARALLRPAPWLMLDEPTEGLDAATERLVLERLSARIAASGQGLLLVSHRPAPLALCERTLDLSRAAKPSTPPLTEAA